MPSSRLNRYRYRCIIFYIYIYITKFSRISEVDTAKFVFRCDLKQLGIYTTLFITNKAVMRERLSNIWNVFAFKRYELRV